MVDLIGQTIGSYQIEAVLGSGGMGQVFRAQHVQLQRAAAFKVLHPQYAADETFRGRFIQEARTAAALVHPNIIEIYDFGQYDDWYYLIMELVQDGSLRSLLSQPGGLPLSIGLDLVRQAADGLAYAHAQGMVHRDIKPDNLLLKRTMLPSEYGNPQIVKISDFGLAKLAEGGMQTVQGQTMGTPAYMSPEQCQAHPLDGRSDIYSLGIVLYEVAIGVVPFQTKRLSDAVYQHVYVEPPLPRAADPRLSPELEGIILRCLKKAPDERYANASELARDLQNVVRSMRASPAAAASGSARGPSSSLMSQPEPSTVRLVFERSRQPLTPGEATTVRVAISAPVDGPRQLKLDLQDVPANWLPARSATVSLSPGVGQTVSLPVTVPRSPAVPAGDYPITVRAASASGDGEPVSAQAVWVVAPYHDVQLDVTPARVSGWSHGRFNVSVTNTGNARAAVVLGGQSVDAALTLALEPALLELDPGMTGRVCLTAHSKARWISGRSLGFNVEARGPEQTHESQAAVFAQRPLLPFLAPLGLLLLVAAIVTGFLLSRGNGVAGDALTPTPLATATASVAAVAAAGSATTTTTPTPSPTTAATATILPTSAATAPATAVPSPVVTPPAVVPPVESLGSLPYFVFSTGRGQPPGILEVYRVSADGSHLTALTQNDQDDWEPAVSYDSTQVAFVSTRDGHNQIYVMDADGSNQRRLSNDAASDEFPLWSSAGSFMVFSSTAGERTKLYLIHADGSGLAELAPSPTGSNWSPNWSPMGDEIVFVSNRSGQPNLYAVKADGSNLRQLTSSGSDDSPRWSYDGSRILFVSRRDGNREIYVMNKDGSDQTRLTDTPVDESDPAWSPDDGRIAFAAGGEVVLMQADGSQRTTLTNGADYDSWLGWSPDGHYLAFTSNRDGNREIYVMQPDGSGLTRLTENPGFDGNPTWAPSLP